MRVGFMLKEKQHMMVSKPSESLDIQYFERLLVQEEAFDLAYTLPAGSKLNTQS